MMSQRSLGLLVGLNVVLAGGPALAQSFNVEFNTDAVVGTWNGAPAETNGCAAELPGTWNKVPIQAGYNNLIDVNGNVTNVDISLYGPDISGPYAADIPGMTGDFDRLFADGMQSNTAHPLQFSIVNLKPGFYTVVTYAPNPYDVITTNVNVPESNEGAKVMPGGISGNAFVEGKTHVTHHAFTSDGHLVIYVFSPTNDFVRVAGFQLRYLGGVYPKLYVNAGASSGLSGSSWATPIRNLEDAMTIAQFSNTVTQIWVADGFYAPTSGTDRTKTFTLRNNLAVYGSFQGVEATLAERHFTFQTSFLSGNIGAATATDNSAHVVTATGVNGTAILDGFAITNGYADGDANPRGGGLAIDNASPTIRNCLFNNNHGADGGAVSFTAQASKAHFSNCDFIANKSAGVGGAVYFRSAANSEVAFGNCRFIGNTSDNTAGAVGSFLGGGGWVRFYNCLFTGNKATNLSGGAIYALGSGNLSYLEHCTVSGNSAASGGGLSNTSGSTITAENCIIYGNTDTDTATDTFAANIQNGGSILVYASCVQAMPRTYVGRGPGCITTDPLFVDANGADNVFGTTDDNCRLQPTSGCIDRGDNTRLTADYADIDQDGNTAELNPVDLDGNPRRGDDPATTDGGVGPAPITDMGAYEVTPTCRPDFDHDGFLTGDDFDAFSAAFVAGELTADYDENGFVNGDDYDSFVVDFEAGC